MINKIVNILHNKQVLPKTFTSHLTPHGFRNSNTQYLRNSGVTDTLAAQMQGHSVNTMHKYYSRIESNDIYDVFG